MHVTLYGELGTLLAFAAQENKKSGAQSDHLGAAQGLKRKNHTPDEGVWYSVVAGACFDNPAKSKSNKGEPTARLFS